MIPSLRSEPASLLTPAATQTQRLALVNWAILAVGILLFALLGAWYAPFVPDDAYISYRYASHLAAGQGLTFNPGYPPVEGYSNFLWIVLLGGMQRVGLDMTVWAPRVSWLFGTAAIACLWWILRRRGVSGGRLALTVGLLVVSGPLALYAVSGMETTLFAALLLAAVLAADYLFARRTIRLGLLLGGVGFLLALTRPEGIVALPVLAACLALSGRWSASGDKATGLGRPLAAAVALFGLLLIAYHVWRVGYFGAFWPTPFLSKGIGGGLPVDTWIANLRGLLLRQSHYYAPFGAYYGLLALLALVGAALNWSRRREHTLQYVALGLAVAYFAVYLNFADWMPGGRYLVPLAGLLLIPFSLLATELRPQGEPNPVRAALPFTLLVAAIGAMSLSGIALLRNESLRLQESTDVSLVSLGRWLRESVPADSVLAIADVGAAPFYAGLLTIDINPQSLTDRHIAEYGWSSDYFYATAPDVVVITAFSLDTPDFYGAHEQLYAQPRFQEMYERIGVVRNDWYQDRAYWVFVRRGLPLSAEQRAAFPQGLRKE